MGGNCEYGKIWAIEDDLRPIIRMNIQLSTHRFIQLRKPSGWIVLLIFLALLAIVAPLPFPTPAPANRHIRIEASMFQFTPGEIQINPGDRVTIELVSRDVVHGFSLDGYHFDLHADPGQTATGTFVANQSGVFRFRCSVACGNMHPL